MPKTIKKFIETRQIIEKYHVLPFEETDSETLKLLSYFLHLAPNIESEHSRKITRSAMNTALNKITSSFEDSDFQFIRANVQINKELEKVNIGDNFINLKKCAFVCKYKEDEHRQILETDLACLLRHIRNAIAHSHFHYKHLGNQIFLMFEDHSTCGKKNISSRIILSRAELARWKKILENA
ncbi:hypothetical protein FACS189425_03300 [Clostridia bacterium]|nr:hypothetical protein FACS189425_03300 [Clostridia bacterium]